jgi:hypothetical protein
MGRSGGFQGNQGSPEPPFWAQEGSLIFWVKWLYFKTKREMCFLSGSLLFSHPHKYLCYLNKTLWRLYLIICTADMFFNCTNSFGKSLLKPLQCQGNINYRLLWPWCGKSILRESVFLDMATQLNTIHPRRLLCNCLKTINSNSNAPTLRVMTIFFCKTQSVSWMFPN